MRFVVGLALLFAFACESSSPMMTGDGGGGAGCESNAECNDGLFCNGAELCAPEDPDADALGCVDGEPPCEAGCDERADECEEGCPDADGDGAADVECGGSDCDDSDANRYPGNTEVCDADDHDEDCNPSTYGSQDADEDGVDDAECCNVDAVGVSTCGRDCDDSAAGVSPVVPDVCNGVDDDCDSLVDEGVQVVLWPDEDGDGHGANDGQSMNGCAGAPGFATRQGDCDDSAAAINPSAVESCNMVDDDCDGTTDEAIVYRDFFPDCDGDGHGALGSTPIHDCVEPSDPPAECSGGRWAIRTGDCRDDISSVFPGTTEACNGLDDDCDGLIDDITDGVQVCVSGTSRACTTGCGTDGEQSCTSCTSWDTCIADEVCNGCDDDSDGDSDEDFGCELGSSQACVVTGCGTMGNQSCSASCEWETACLGAAEICNYCDDDGDGNFNEEQEMATLDDEVRFGCSPTFGNARCASRSIPNGMELWAEILDGSAHEQAGAVWVEPTDFVSGWGPVTVIVELEARVIADGTYNTEAPLGGWAIVITDSGDLGVGSAQSHGVPSGLTGIVADWFWQNEESCFTSGNPPPPQSDAVAYSRLNGNRELREPGGGNTDVGCENGEAVGNDLNSGTTTAVTQRMSITYTPDNPITAGVNEEHIVLSAGGNTYHYRPTDMGVGGAIPNNDLPIGTGPLRIGITAGNYVGGPYNPGPPGQVGVRVEAEARLWGMTFPSGPEPPDFNDYVIITREDACP